MRDDSPSAGVRVRSPRAAAIRAVALFEAFKGALVLVAASGLLSLVHRDVHAAAAALMAHLHLNPAAHYPSIFLDAAANVHDSRLLTLAAGATAYALVRFVEAYGLFGEKAWAEVLAAVSGGVYVPFEIAGLVARPTWHGALLLAVNLAIVALMVAALLLRRHVKRVYWHTHQANAAGRRLYDKVTSHAGFIVYSQEL